MDLKRHISTRQLVLLAHGSRDARWCGTFEKGLEIINRHLDKKACLAYFEMASPSLESVISKRYLSGVRDMAILPLFFAEGRHLLQDVPQQIARLQKQYGDLNITLLEAVGCQEKFWDFLGVMISTEYKSETTSVNH